MRVYFNKIKHNKLCTAARFCNASAKHMTLCTKRISAKTAFYNQNCCYIICVIDSVHCISQKPIDVQLCIQSAQEQTHKKRSRFQAQIYSYVRPNNNISYFFKYTTLNRTPRVRDTKNRFFFFFCLVSLCYSTRDYRQSDPYCICLAALEHK